MLIQKIVVKQLNISYEQSNANFIIKGIINPDDGKHKDTWYVPLENQIMRVDILNNNKSLLLEKIEYKLNNLYKNFTINIPLPYEKLALYPGTSELNCILYLRNSENEKEYKIYQNKINFTQPQLMLFVFESNNLNINVKNRDVAPLKTFYEFSKKNKGKGNGDLYFNFDNKTKTLFTSTFVKASGHIPYEKGHFLFMPNSSITMNFYDHDIM